MKINDLLNALKAQEINCSEEQLNLLNTFMKVTLETNEKFNLTAIKNEDEFVEKMIYDSALALYDLDLAEKSIIDVGTGAGFPGMVIKILEPKAKVTLLDSTAKKINHLLGFAKEQNIKVEGIANRAEDYARNNREIFDYATARAVSQLNILLELIKSLLIQMKDKLPFVTFLRLLCKMANMLLTSTAPKEKIVLESLHI